MFIFNGNAHQRWWAQLLGKQWHAERFESSIYIFTMFMFVPGVHSFRISDVPSSVDAKRVNQVPFIHGGKWQNPHCRSCLMKKTQIIVHPFSCLHLVLIGYVQFQGLVSSLPLFLGCTCLFGEKTCPPSSKVITSSRRVSTSLASQLPLLASQVASSAVSSWADAMWTRSKLHSGPGITIETIPSSSGIILLGMIHGLTHYSDIVLTYHLEVYMAHNIYI